MAYDLKEEADVKEFIDNLGIEYRFGCYHEQKAEVCHLLGDYLEAIKKDFDKAAKVYKTNCDEYNFAKSCYKFGNYTLVGKGKQKENPELALEYYKRGCELGEPDACFNGGSMCITKDPQSKREKDYTQDADIKPDMGRAFQYSTKACEMGNMYACANLSQMYRRGDGVEKDEIVADKYKKKAMELQEEVKKQATLTFQEGL